MYCIRYDFQLGGVLSGGGGMCGFELSNFFITFGFKGY